MAFGERGVQNSFKSELRILPSFQIRYAHPISLDYHQPTVHSNCNEAVCLAARILLLGDLKPSSAVS